jgi:hypothetical protein
LKEKRSEIEIFQQIGLLKRLLKWIEVSEVRNRGM